MDEKLFIFYLKELAAKYSGVDDLDVLLDKGKVTVTCSKGKYVFVYDFSLLAETENEYAVPLLHWRNKRRYVELRNIVKTGMVEKPLAMRIHHIVPRGEFDSSLLNIIVQEIDLVEFITEQKTNKIFADFSGMEYTNCIASTDGNIKVSLELGFSPEGSEPVLLHEVVARTGIASDVVVDTQMMQYPIYVIKGKETEHYTDVDSELYDLENTQADCVRFILQVLAEPECIAELQLKGKHLMNVWQAAEQSSKELIYTEVRDEK